LQYVRCELASIQCRHCQIQEAVREEFKVALGQGRQFKVPVMVPCRPIGTALFNAPPSLVRLALQKPTLHTTKRADSTALSAIDLESEPETLFQRSLDPLSHSLASEETLLHFSVALRTDHWLKLYYISIELLKAKKLSVRPTQLSVRIASQCCGQCQVSHRFLRRFANFMKRNVFRALSEL